MKKGRILIAVLVCSLMLMGVGYAWWNETLVMATTAETGKMDVKFTSNTDIVVEPPFVDAWVGKNIGASTFDLDAESEFVVEANVESMDLMHNPRTYYYDEAKCKLSNLYPGAEVKVKVCVKNVGTIPVKYKDVEFTGKPDWLQCTVTDINAGTQINKNDTKTFYLTFSVPESETGNQDKDADFDIKFNWKQFNQQ